MVNKKPVFKDYQQYSKKQLDSFSEDQNAMIINMIIGTINDDCMNFMATQHGNMDYEEFKTWLAQDVKEYEQQLIGHAKVSFKKKDFAEKFIAVIHKEIISKHIKKVQRIYKKVYEKNRS